MKMIYNIIKMIVLTMSAIIGTLIVLAISVGLFSLIKSDDDRKLIKAMISANQELIEVHKEVNNRVTHLYSGDELEKSNKIIEERIGKAKEKITKALLTNSYPNNVIEASADVIGKIEMLGGVAMFEPDIGMIADYKQLISEKNDNLLESERILMSLIK